MTSVPAILAALTAILHVLFVVFVVAGGVLALRRPWVAWLHAPAALWAVYIELSGGVCPLTPLENALRARAGLDAYAGDFVARYVFPLLYPAGLTRDMQIALAAFVVVVNACVYALVLRSRWLKA